MASEVMVPFVMKIEPSLLAEVKAAAAKVKGDRWWKKGIGASAFIRRAIQRDLDHARRSRGKATK